MANGRIIGPDNISTGGFSGVASGIWSLTEQLAAIKAGNWPLTGSPFEIKSYDYKELSSAVNFIIVDRPTPTEIGDVLILVVYATDSRTITEATLGGNDWTVVDEDFDATSNNIWKGLYTLTVADATTSWRFEFSNGGTTNPGYVIVNVGTFGEIDNGGTSFARAGYTNQNIQAPSVDFSNTTNLDLIIAGGRSFVSTAPAGFTTLVNTTDGRPDTYFGYRENITPTSTGTTTMSIDDRDVGLYRIVLGDTRTRVVNIRSYDAQAPLGSTPAITSSNQMIVVLQRNNTNIIPSLLPGFTSIETVVNSPVGRAIRVSYAQGPVDAQSNTNIYQYFVLNYATGVGVSNTVNTGTTTSTTVTIPSLSGVTLGSTLLFFQYSGRVSAVSSPWTFIVSPISASYGAGFIAGATSTSYLAGTANLNTGAYNMGVSVEILGP